MNRESNGSLLSTVFVDYDNIYLSLKRKSEEAAKRFAKDAGVWLKEIETGGLITPTNGGPLKTPRRIVMNRCYGNPVPRRNEQNNATDMNSFPFVRHHFLRSGFEIIDCPPLTAQLKNSADIRMVMDVRDYLIHDTYFDEFIILSGDADFTPVLHRLRAHARRTVIFANDYTAAPYTAISDGEVRESDLIALLLEGRLPKDGQGAVTGGTKQLPSPEMLAAMRKEIIAEVQITVRDAEQPVPLEALADRAVRVLGHEKTVGSAWGGAGSFRDLLVNGLPADMKLSDSAPYYVAAAEAGPGSSLPPAPGQPAAPITARAEPGQAHQAAPEPALPGVASPHSAQLQAAPQLRSDDRGTPVDENVQSDHHDRVQSENLVGPAATVGAIARQSTPRDGEGSPPPANEPARAGALQHAPAPAQQNVQHNSPAQAPVQAPPQPSYQPQQQAPAPQQTSQPPNPQSQAPQAGRTAPTATTLAQRTNDAVTATQQDIARIHEACQAPPLSPQQYSVVFDVMAEELNANGLTGASTLVNIAQRAAERGVELRRDDARFVLEVVSEVDPWFEQGASANLFASRFQNFVVARCRSQGLMLSAAQLDLISKWFSGGTPRASSPTSLPGPAHGSNLPPQQPSLPHAASATAPSAPPAQGSSYGMSGPAAELETDEFPRIIRRGMRN